MSSPEYDPTKRFYYEYSTELVNHTYRDCRVVFDRRLGMIVMKIYDDDLVDIIMNKLNEAPT